MRSSRSWGLGDVADLADLAAWSGHELGADFILVNPLHAASPVPPMAPSPYLPVTRRFANPIYLRVEGVPEFAYLSDAVRGSVAALAATVQVTNTSAELLERDPVWAAKRAALEVVHDVPRTPGRQAAYDEFREREGAGLDDFALWCALSDTYGEPDAWPEELADPHGEAAEAARVTLAEKVEFHRWLQWVLDEQLGQAQAAATAAGMAIGVMHDLAVGVHPEGADAWALRDVLAKGVAVGAPPDMYNQMGQDWSQPPWRPDALAEQAFIPYRDMLRTVLRHAGGIRIDHVIGLFRLWWIPRGMPANQGTYVRYDHDAMVGILALEAQRAGAVVIGEDLGTVEAVGAGHAPGARHPRHLDPVVREDRRQPPPAARALARAHARQRHDARPAADRGLHRGRARAAARRARPAGHVVRRGARGARGRPRGLAGSPVRARPAARGRGRGGDRRGAAPATSRARRRGCSRSRWRTRWATAGRRTSRAPTRSTRTGGCRSPTPTAPPSSSTTCRASTCCAGSSPRCADDPGGRGRLGGAAAGRTG